MEPFFGTMTRLEVIVKRTGCRFVREVAATLEIQRTLEEKERTLKTSSGTHSEGTKSTKPE